MTVIPMSNGLWWEKKKIAQMNEINTTHQLFEMSKKDNDNDNYNDIEKMMHVGYIYV